MERREEMRWIMKTFAFVCMAATTVPVWAAEDLESAKMMEPVIVTAGRTEEKTKNVTQSMTVIPNDELKKNQYSDLGDMLRNYGVSVNTYGPNQSLSQISIRGIKTPLMGDPMNSPILLLIDGHRAGTANISMIPTVSIERIEILRGPASVQYGTSAIGGVVNVITKRGGKDLKLALEAGGGSWETWRGQAGASGSIGAFDFAGGVSYTAIDDNFKTGNGDTYYNTKVNHKTSYVANLGLNFLEGHRLGVSVLGSDSDKMGMPNALPSNDRDAYSDRSNYTVDVNYEGGNKNYGLNWQLRYFNANDDYKAVTPSNALWGVDPTSKAKSGNQGSQAQLSWASDIFTLTGGLDWLDNKYRAHQNQSKTKTENIAGFLLGKVALFDEQFVLSAGLRYDDYTLEYEGDKRDLDNTSYSLGMAYHPLKWLTLRANYGESYRVPTGMEIAGYTYYGWNYLGDSNLNPEKGKGWDVGGEINYKSLNMGLTYFQIDYEDKIATRSVGWNYQYYNISGKTKYRGIEGTASFDLGDFFNWPFMLRPYINATHLFEYKDSSGNTLKNVRNTDIAYGVNFQYPSIGLDTDLRFTYLGHQLEKDWYYDQGTVKKTGGDTVVDFFLSKTIHDWEDAGKLSVKGELRNIFDVNYSTILGYPMPGRSFYIGLRYDY